jgi:NAD(P)-dependent dehydrogenase (short-subunit alcohol dehydrogenase family)
VADVPGFEVDGAVAIITGAGSGIGAALARRLHADGAGSVVVVDRDREAARAVADDVGGVAECVDVSEPGAVDALVARTLDRERRIDLFCSNAGVATGAGIDATDDVWRRTFDVNVMAHVYAARAVVPAMLRRGRGHLLNTASAAGLLTSPGDAPYTLTKHAAVALAEWLALTYGGQANGGNGGIGVSVLCPMGVATPLLMEPLAAGDPAAQAVAASGDILSADEVAAVAVQGITAGRFLILPHPQVGTFWAQKASDVERWLAGMRRLVQT